jgi:molecular chaperone HtpG
MRKPTAPRYGTFRVDFDSIIKILADNLYANPQSAVRELIQNANDSCVRRQAVADFPPVIRIMTDNAQRTMVFEDNGSGMLEDEVIRHLASIGGSNTREQRKRLETANSQAASMLIGQFGIGFLSAFVIADEVVVETCSTDNGASVRWECQGSTSYTIQAGNRETPGTAVTLVLKPQHYDLLEEAVLRDVIVRYADFISFPIYLNDSRQPVNRLHAPWHTDASELEYADYLQHRYGVAPLALEPIAADDGEFHLRGVLFVPPRTELFRRRLRAVEIFQRRMYVGEELHLLPEWATFVYAIIESSSLELVASREGVIEHRPGYERARDYLQQAVGGFISRLAAHERGTFEEIVRQHPWAVIAGAVHNDAFFNWVKDLIPLQSDAGPITLPKYLSLVPQRFGAYRTIYYVSGEGVLGPHHAALFQAAGVPILRVDVMTEQLLRKYADRTPGTGLRQVESGVVELVEPEGDPAWQGLERRYADLGITARAVRYRPAELAAIAVREADYDRERVIAQVMDGSRPLQDLMTKEGTALPGAYGLCFNVTNPTIHRLTQFGVVGEPEVLDTVLTALYGTALLGAGVLPAPELNQQLAEAQTSIIDLLLRQVAAGS